MSDNRSTTVLDSPPNRFKGSNPKEPASNGATGQKEKSSKADGFFGRLIAFFSSLRLTVVCLFLGMLLVFCGTIAQVELGLFKAQNEFFRSFLVVWAPTGGSWKIILPGGYLVGGLLLINLVTAHFTRFKWTRKKAGIWLTHVGIILLLVGQLLTDVLSRESHMWLSEGQAKNYSDSSSHQELAVVDTSNPDYDDVVAFSDSMVSRKEELRNAKLPFTIRVKEYFANSDPRIRAPMVDKSEPQVSQGIGQRLTFLNAATTAAMDSRNIPAAIVEVLTPEGSLGTWLVSNWLVEEKLVQILGNGFRSQLGEGMGSQLAAALGQPQQFSYGGHTYQIALRPVRFYNPFTIQLQKFSHDIYRGTDIPKNFSSRVRLLRPDTGEDREVLIYMNNPLRYAGETYYQSGFDDVDPRVTILQVVHNPSWLTPYLSCLLVAAGLIVQFMTHLVGFITKRRTA
jgi:ResB-like family